MDKRVGDPYESFLELPVAVTLAVLWLAGAVLEAACVVALYEGYLVMAWVLEAVL